MLSLCRCGCVRPYVPSDSEGEAAGIANRSRAALTLAHPLLRCAAAAVRCCCCALLLCAAAVSCCCALLLL
jgi:hypothetical protein